MKYFVTDEQREGTCYHEFYKGKWDEKTFWKKDSLSLHDDILFRIDEFEKAIVRVIPGYDPFGETEVYPAQWEEIGRIIRKKDNIEAIELYLEADTWAQDVFSSFECFTILGI